MRRLGGGMRSEAAFRAVALTFLAAVSILGGGEARPEPWGGDAELHGGQRLRRLWQDEVGAAPSGSPAECGRHPYIVSLRDMKNTHMCSGVLVDPRAVLTSAGCVTGPEGGQQYIAVVGACRLEDALNETNDGGKVEIFQTKQVITHENWTGSIEDGYDIALIVLDGESSRSVIGLAAAKTQVRQNDRVAMVGWGLDGTGKKVQELQLVEDVQVVMNDFCDEENGWPFLKDTMLCTTQIDLCRGDRGSPLIELFAPKGNPSGASPNFDVLVGIASFDDEEAGCGEDRRPDVYTRVSNVRGWIEKEIEALRAPPPAIVALETGETGAMNETTSTLNVTSSAQNGTANGQNGTEAMDENSDCALCAMNNSLCFFCGS